MLTNVLVSPTEPPQCGDPGIPLNGGRVVHGTTEGKRVEFFCNDGYELEGDGERVCLSTGEWKGSVPTCTGTNVSSWI